jgi:hypothetical protein
MIASHFCFLAFLKEFFTFLFLAVENRPISWPTRLANQENRLVSRSKPVWVQPDLILSAFVHANDLGL